MHSRESNGRWPRVRAAWTDTVFFPPRLRALLPSLLLAALSLAGFLLVSCAGVQRTVLAPPGIEGAHFTGNKTCFECHTNITRGFSASPHARLHVEGARMQEASGCESCHGPGSRHVAAGGGRGKFIHNPGRDAATCFTCHLQTHAEFNLPQHHPVLEHRMNCVQCHDPHGADIMQPAGGLALSRLNQQCAPCHREQSQPRVYEHEAMREGCTACHNPHGSIHAKMLAERDNNLCLKCHAQTQGASLAAGEFVIGKIPHSQLMSRGSCWSSGCHTAVHGSNVSPRMFY